MSVEEVLSQRKNIHVYDVPGTITAYLFDLKKDLKPQLDAAQERLAEEQSAWTEIADTQTGKAPHMSSASLLQTYIWLIDAQDHSLTRPDMRDQLYATDPLAQESNHRKVNRHLREALRLRDGDYTHLVDDLLS